MTAKRISASFSQSIREELKAKQDRRPGFVGAVHFMQFVRDYPLIGETPIMHEIQDICFPSGTGAELALLQEKLNCLIHEATHIGLFVKHTAGYGYHLDVYWKTGETIHAHLQATFDPDDSTPLTLQWTVEPACTGEMQ